MGSVLEQLSFWPRLTAPERERVERAVRPVTYEAGQMIWSGDSDCLGVLMIRSGVVRLFLSSADGREATIARMADGEVCALTAACVLHTTQFNIRVQAEGRVEGLVLPALCLSGLVEENPYVENFIYRGATQLFAQVMEAVEQLLFCSLEQRLAVFLLDEGARLGTDTLRVTQEQMAQAIGSAREAVTRTLKKLVAAGAVELFRGGVRLTDRKALYRLVSRP